jgi:N6-adenosine-specific RNA methylase IME4
MKSIPSSPAPSAAAIRPIAEIIVGERIRHDLGDIAGFAARIAKIGRLLHPIPITPDGRLIAGERRLEACKLLGWAEVPVHVVDLDDIDSGEVAENIDRKDFLPSEIDAIRRKYEAKLKAAAKERMSAGGKGAKVSQPLRTTDKIGAFAGVSGRTVEKIAAVVDAAEAEPERFGKLLADMDRTGRVNGPFKRLRVMKQAALIRAEPPPLPGNGPYRVAVVDIPWAYEPEGDAEKAAHRGVLPYPTMNIDQACAFTVASIMHVDAIIWLWVTNFILAQGLHVTVLRAWDFEPKTIETWPKDQVGRGDWLKGQTEHVVMAVRGNPIVESATSSTLLKGPFHLVRKYEHSEKPIEFYDFVEKLCPAPRYADLFSRYRHNDRWDCHGDEAPALVEAREAAE